MFRRLSLVTMSLLVVAAGPKEDRTQTRSAIGLDGTWCVFYMQNELGNFYGIGAFSGKITIGDNRIVRADKGFGELGQGAKLICRDDRGSVDIQLPERQAKCKMLPGIRKLIHDPDLRYEYLKICFSTDCKRPSEFPVPGRGEPGVKFYYFYRFRR